ncbi:MAG: hypothetical protein GOV02_01800 [Candidatus Aenigmarchaeota archaeon]|nr:hypothetical protein [Candidatus Aenigmarchaeota archaeon]
MKKIFLVIGALLAFFSLTAIGVAVVSSYGSITGYAIIEESITIDIIGSSNDANYTIKAHQGETAYSPKIKLKNAANTEIDIIVNITTDHPDDIKISMVDETKNTTITNPLSIPPEDLYFYIKKEIKPTASPGNYSFSIEIIPD